MLAGTGGTETFTAGHVRELNARGIDAQIVIIGSAVTQSRENFPDIPVVGLGNETDLSDLDGTVVFVNRAYDIPTRNQAALFLHCVVPSTREQDARKKDAKGRIVFAASDYNAKRWEEYLDLPSNTIHIVKPFADPAFGKVARPPRGDKVKVLYAGRLHPDKGIYTILEMLHLYEMKLLDVDMNIVMAGQHVEEGIVIARMLRDYPYANLIEPRKTVGSMASLLAEIDILLMPSVYAEPFGMLSVEAQHSGARVIASNLGGLPETDCGLLTLVEPRNPEALIAAIHEAMKLGSPTEVERNAATAQFTLTKSVDALLKYLPH